MPGTCSRAMDLTKNNQPIIKDVIFISKGFCDKLNYKQKGRKSHE
jgi:hypothetical protein